MVHQIEETCAGLSMLLTFMFLSVYAVTLLMLIGVNAPKYHSNLSQVDITGHTVSGSAVGAPIHCNTLTCTEDTVSTIYRQANVSYVGIRLSDIEVRTKTYFPLALISSLVIVLGLTLLQVFLFYKIKVALKKDRDELVPLMEI